MIERMDGVTNNLKLIDFASVPDVTYINSSAGTSGTATIAVVKKPRLIAYAIWSRSSSYAGVLAFIDVEADKGIRAGYFSSAGHNFEDNVNFKNYFPTISENQIVYNIAAWGGNHRVYIGIYY